MAWRPPCDARRSGPSFKASTTPRVRDFSTLGAETSMCVQVAHATERLVQAPPVEDGGDSRDGSTRRIEDAPGQGLEGRGGGRRLLRLLGFRRDALAAFLFGRGGPRRAQGGRVP